MVRMIKLLLEKGYAYKKGNSIYFSIEKFPAYGKLANIKAENLQLGSSVDLDEYDKDNVQDFVLWKGEKEGDPSWPADFGSGRPGWHIECSAMSMKYLGESMDIHMGGVDNIFPHHENEIAQSEAATGKRFVNYWVHCQHLVLEKEKMSKSLGNFYTVPQLIELGYDPMAIRYLLISTHYRKLLNFSLDGLKAAGKAIKRIQNFIFTLSNLKPETGETPEILEGIKSSEKDFQSNMNNDLNISGALGVFFDFIHDMNLKQNTLKDKDIREINNYLDRINSVLGIIREESRQSLDQEIEEKIRLREKAREERDFKTADQIRDDLKARGIILIDTPDGTRWKVEKG
jgi:cysteinyl-tRNA synthetase